MAKSLPKLTWSQAAVSPSAQDIITAEYMAIIPNVPARAGTQGLQVQT